MPERLRSRSTASLVMMSVDLSGGKKELKPGSDRYFQSNLCGTERDKDKLEALINVVCNDPNGPIRLIKVTAYK